MLIEFEDLLQRIYIYIHGNRKKLLVIITLEKIIDLRVHGKKTQKNINVC